MSRATKQKQVKRRANIPGITFDAFMLHRNRSHLHSVLTGKRPGRSLTRAYYELKANQRRIISDMRNGVATCERVQNFCKMFGLGLLSRFSSIKLQWVSACRAGKPVSKYAEKHLKEALDYLCSRFERGLPKSKSRKGAKY